MPRRYRRRHRYTVARPLKTTKYSNETYGTVFNIVANAAAAGSHGIFVVPVIPNALNGVLGTRKVKNFTLRIIAEQTAYTDNSGGQPVITFDRSRVAFALVYVPEGTTPSALQFGVQNNPTSLYEPNQNVIMSGIIDSLQCYSFKTRLARNLNAGDQIALATADLTPITTNGDSTNTPVTFTMNYAISF